MAEKTLAEQVKSDIEGLQSSLRDLQSSARLTEIRDRVEDLGTTAQGLTQRIGALRQRGYAFEPGLEKQALDLGKEWSRIEPGIKSELQRESLGLERSLQPLELEITRIAGENLTPVMKRPRVEKLKAEVNTLEGRIEAVEGKIRGGFDQFGSRLQVLQSQLGKLEWMLAELGEASFELLATESGIMAVKAVWARSEKQAKDDPEGVLYLTDQRILFERKEKVATQKVLFVTTKKELVQELLWQAPVGLVEETKSRKEGFLNKDDYLDLWFARGGPLDVAHLHIWQRGDEWQALINRAKAKEFDANRAIPIDEEVLNRVANAPTKCPSCGGAIKQVILRGLENINCEYCGDVIRI